VGLRIKFHAGIAIGVGGRIVAHGFVLQGMFLAGPVGGDAGPDGALVALVP
jgi:hypothetical protein